MSAVCEAMQNFGDERLILDSMVAGLLLQGGQVMAVDADVQDGVFLAAGDGLSNLFTLSLTHIASLIRLSFIVIHLYYGYARRRERV